ncbi:MAG: hypothetical protein JO112_15100 [Planctomycetes bacterium]|nr:hypothetical protein [Planctomycetota bacterium]
MRLIAMGLLGIALLAPAAWSKPVQAGKKEKKPEGIRGMVISVDKLQSDHMFGFRPGKKKKNPVIEVHVDNITQYYQVTDQGKEKVNAKALAPQQNVDVVFDEQEREHRFATRVTILEEERGKKNP